jgi:tripartite-type tricarboxylate transporter receptor subunit TctC
VSSSKRVPTLPNTPTLEEYGFKNFEVSTWNGFFAVQSTPEKVINFLNNEVNAILKEADTIKRFTELGIEPKVSSPQELGERMKSEIEKWNKVVRNMEPL